MNYVDIYSCSWGPDDNGFEVAEAGVMTEEVLRQGALKVQQCLYLFFILFSVIFFLKFQTS